VLRKELITVLKKDFWIKERNIIAYKKLKMKENISILTDLIKYTDFLQEGANTSERFFHLVSGTNEYPKCKNIDCSHKVTKWLGKSYGSYCSTTCFLTMKKLPFYKKIDLLNLDSIETLTLEEARTFIYKHILRTDTSKIKTGVVDIIGLETSPDYLEIGKFIWGQTQFLAKDALVSERIYCILNNIYEQPLCHCGKALVFTKFSEGYSSFCSRTCKNISFNLDYKDICAKFDSSIPLLSLESTKKELELYYFKNGKLLSNKLKMVGLDKRTLSLGKSIWEYTQFLPLEASVYERVYNIINSITTRSLCINCKKPNTRFINYQEGYNKYCSLKCSGEDINRRIPTIIARYGYDSVFKVPSILKKSDSTNLERYGTINPGAYNKDCRQKAENTNFQNSGYRFSVQVPQVRKAGYQSKMEAYYKIICESDLLEGQVKPLFTKLDYKGVQYPYKWECLKCGTKFEKKLSYKTIPRCPTCYPPYISIGESEVLAFIKTLALNVESGNRTILKGKELDIYLSDLNLAFEYNGIYYHSETNGKDSRYHLNKTVLCQQQSIELTHIFEDEWLNKEEIVKSIIRTKLKVLNKTIYGRKCELKLIKSEEAELFYSQNHLQGSIKSKVNIGLFYNEELVSCLSFSKPRFNKKYNWEITRYANKLNTSIVGGFAKLLKYFEKNYKGSIITYSDRRWFTGDIYENNGFTRLKPSNPSYFYLVNGKRESRIKYQKHKLANILEEFDPELTEYENMLINGYDRIWDCGNNVFVKD